MSAHPEFVRFADAFRHERYDEALTCIDALIASYPDQAPLHWHRANCLEKLERDAEVPQALDRVLALSPDYAPAIVKRVQYSNLFADVDEVELDDLDEAALSRIEREQQARAQAATRHNEAELRRALALDPNLVDGLYLLSNTLREYEDAESLHAEADALLDRAIELAPLRVDLIEARATRRRTAALCEFDRPVDADTIQTFQGIRYSRGGLEAALADYDTAHALAGGYRFAVRKGMILHDLGRYDEALASYDEALGAMDSNDPKRQFILETRALSENNGAGEREQTARMIEDAVRGDGKDRVAIDDIAAQAMLSAAQAIRAGKPLNEAIDARISEDPDDLMAINIAQQILNVAHEPAPQLEVVDAGSFPSYQRRHVEQLGTQAEAIGLRTVGDAEAKGMFLVLGQRVLLRFFADESGEIGIAGFAMKPKWPGFIGFLLLLLTGKWRTHRMLECVTQFDDGTHLSTQYENPSVFEFGDKIQIERVSLKTSMQDLVARHAERVAAHKATHPQAVAMVADDLEGMEHRWREGQRVKRAFRSSIGYVTDAELKRLLGAHHARFATKVKAKLAMLADDLAEHN